MGQVTLADTTNNALKVELASQLAGEDITNQWLSTNLKGYLTVAGKAVTVDSSTTAKNIGDTTSDALGVDTEVISIFNPGTVRLWVAFRQSVKPAGSRIATAVPIDPGLTLTVPVYTKNDDPIQLSFILDSGSTSISVPVVGMGNSTS